MSKLCLALMISLSTACSATSDALTSDALWQAVCDTQPRSQEPKQRPYIIREVTIDGADANVRLAGELTMPEGDGPFPGIVLISGSEVVDRDSKVLGHKPFLVLSDFLTRNGYAVFRYDDRGYGESTGDTYAALDSDFAADAAAAFNWLTTQDKVEANRSGYIGHSQGGFKAPVAAQSTTPSFMIFLAGGVQPLGTLLLTQAYDIGVVAGMTAEELDLQDQQLRVIFKILRRSGTVEAARQRIVNWAFQQGATRKEATNLADLYATPWMMAELQRGNTMYGDTDEYITQIISDFHGPILAMYAGKDLLVSAAINAPLTEPLLGHPNSKVVVLPGLNHFFQPAITGGVEEMCDIETTIDPSALFVIADWLSQSAR